MKSRNCAEKKSCSPVPIKQTKQKAESFWLTMQPAQGC